MSIALMVNPRNVSVALFRLGAQERVLRGADRIDLSRILPDLTLTVQELFGALSLD